MKLSIGLACVALGAVCGACAIGAKDRTEAQFCDEYGKRECLKVAAYCSFTASACEPVRVAACRERAAASKTAARQYNAGNGDLCLDALDKAYATLPIDAARLAALDTTCQRVFQGSAHAGDDCSIDYDCDGKLVCDRGRCGSSKVVAAGAGCANIGETCPVGQYCGVFRELPTCVARVAQAAACDANHPCLEALLCNGTCAPRLEMGAPCTADQECLSGYCTRYVAPSARKCSVGLTFSPDAPSCLAFLGGADAGSSP